MLTHRLPHAIASGSRTIYNPYMRRLSKQLLYGLLYLVIFIGIPVGMYFGFLKPAPTCFDGIQNGKEQGIDCGGACAEVCIPPTLKPIEALNGLKQIPIDAERTTLFAEVVNANPDFAAWNFGYVLTLEDGSSTKQFQGNSYIYGGEIKTLAFPNLAVGNITGAKIEFQNPQWLPAEAWKRPMLRVQNASTKREEGKLLVEGELLNDDAKAFKAVEVVSIFLGQFGEIVGVSKTEIAEVAPSVYRAFSVYHPDIPDVDVSKTLVELHAFRE